MTRPLQSAAPLWREFQSKLHDLLESLLINLPGVTAIDSRVKTLESIRAKLDRLGSHDITAISDIVGVRIRVRSGPDIAPVIQILTREFDVARDQVARPTEVAASDRAHFVLGLSLTRQQLPEWRHLAASRAEVQVVTEHLHAVTELEHESRYKGGRPGPVEPAPRTLSQLHATIDRFVELLARPDVHEKRDVHPFLNENQFILHPNPSDVWSEVAIGLGTQHRLDFLIREADGSYVLVEIENPAHLLFTRKGDFTPPVGHAQRQVEDWQEWIEDNLATVQKVYPDMIAPRGVVVIGRSVTLSAEQRHRLRRRNINTRGRLVIMTYDDLLDSARSYVSGLARHLDLH